MKIKAKKTNSASENAIWSSCFVIELRKLIHLTCSTEVTEVTDSCTLVSYFGLKCKWVESTLSTNQPDVVDCPRANRSPPLDCLHSPIFSWNRRDILSRYSASGSLPLMVAILIFKWKPVTQSARSRRSYGKIEDCEQSNHRLLTTVNYYPVDKYYKNQLCYPRKAIPVV